MINKARFFDDTAFMAKYKNSYKIYWADWLALEGSMTWKSTLTNHK